MLEDNDCKKTSLFEELNKLADKKVYNIALTQFTKIAAIARERAAAGEREYLHYPLEDDLTELRVIGVVARIKDFFAGEKVTCSDLLRTEGGAWTIHITWRNV